MAFTLWWQQMVEGVKDRWIYADSDPLLLFFLDMRAIAIALLLLKSTIQPINHVVKEDFRYDSTPSYHLSWCIYFCTNLEFIKFKKRKKRKDVIRENLIKWEQTGLCFRTWKRLKPSDLGLITGTSWDSAFWTADWIKNSWITSLRLNLEQFTVCYEVKINVFQPASDRSWLRLAGIPLSSSKSTSANLETSSFHSSLLNSCWKIPDSVPGKSLLGPLQFYRLPQVL